MGRSRTNRILGAMRVRGGRLAVCETLAFLVLLTTSATPAGAGPLSGSFPLIPAVRPDTVHAAANPSARLSVDPDLLVRLQVLADALHKEIVLCLHGNVVGDTVRLTRMTMPDPRRSDTSGALFGPCQQGTLATWHNHPVPPPGLRVPRAVGAGGKPDLCRLSETDVRTAASSGHPFTLVSVDASTLCWWTLQEVRELARRKSSNAGSIHVY